MPDAAPIGLPRRLPRRPRFPWRRWLRAIHRDVGYAVLLLFLATSGLFMLAGRKGLVGRGGVLLVLGILVPVLYVVLAGGP